MIGSKHSFRLFSEKKEIPNSDPKVETQHQEEDNKKRDFLKLAGVVGVGAVVASLIPRKAEALVFGSTPTSNTVGMKNAANVRISPATETTLATLGTEATLATVAKESGGNLDTIAGKDFATQTTLAQIKTQTDKFTFSGSNLLTAATGNSTTVQNAAGTTINPSTEESVVFLRRIVRLLESQAVVDSSNRQRITLDSIAASLTLTTVTTVSTVTSVTNVATIGSYAVNQMFSDVAKNTYANSIRRNLTFS